MLVLKIALGVMLGLAGFVLLASLVTIGAAAGGAVAVLLLVALAAGVTATVGLTRRAAR
jgi:hypothetical protein